MFFNTHIQFCGTLLKKLISEEDSNIHTKFTRVNASEPNTNRKKYQQLDKRLLNPVSTRHSKLITQPTVVAQNIIY